MKRNEHGYITPISKIKSFWIEFENKKERLEKGPRDPKKSAKATNKTTD